MLGYSGGLRAYTLAAAVGASPAVVIFSIAIGAIFGFMMPFGAVVGMSRGGFLWHFVRNVLLGIPLMLGMLLLIVAAFVFFFIEILLNLVTLPISKIYQVIAGMAGIRLDDQPVEEETDWLANRIAAPGEHGGSSGEAEAIPRKRSRAIGISGMLMKKRRPAPFLFQKNREPGLTTHHLFDKTGSLFL